MESNNYCFKLGELAIVIHNQRLELEDKMRERGKMICDALEAGLTPTEIARAAGISRSLVYVIKQEVER